MTDPTRQQLPTRPDPASDDRREHDDPARPGVPGGEQSTRRRLLVWLIRLGTGAFALAFALPALAIRSLTLVTKEVAPGDVLVYAPTSAGAPVGEPLKASDLAAGAGIQVYPQGKTDNANNLIELVRVNAGAGPDSLVAYSAICTHLGCAVYAKLNQQGLIACPCHGSLFDPREDAKVIGGPAPRPLPSLPVRVDPNGNVVVAGSFSGPIGPQ